MNYLSTHKNVGATASLGTAAEPGNIMLGNPFFNPDLVGVASGAFLQAQMLIMMHEAVHSVGDKTDADFGGSQNLTQDLVSNCFPAIKGSLGNLGF